MGIRIVWDFGIEHGRKEFSWHSVPKVGETVIYASDILIVKEVTHDIADNKIYVRAY